MLLEDIEASALIGLWRAIEKFDPSKGVPFESFAKTKINGAILDDIREEDHSSRTLRDHQKEIGRATQDWINKYDAPPTHAELAQSLGVSEGELQKQQKRIHESHMVSLDAPLSQANEGTIGETIVSLEDTRTVDKQRLLAVALSPLTKRERLLFALLYFEGLTLDQAAPILKMTHPMTCQCHLRISEYLAECWERARKKA